MWRKTIIAAVVILLLGGGSYYIYFIYLEKLARTPFAAVPPNSAVVIEYKSLNGLHQSFQKNALSEATDTFPLLTKFKKQVRSFYKIFDPNQSLKQSLNQNHTLLTIQNLPADTTGTLYIFEQEKDLLELVNYDALSRLVKKISKNETYQVTTEKSDELNTTVYHIAAPNLKWRFSCAYKNSLLLVSDHAKALEAGIKQLKSNSLFERDNAFKIVEQLSSEDQSINIYLQYKELSVLLKRLLHPTILDNSNFIGQLGRWTTFDCIPMQQNVLFSGYTLLHDTSSNFLQRLWKQQPQPNTLFGLLPPNTSFLYWMGFSDYEQYFQQSTSGSQNKHFSKNIAPWIGNEVAFAQINYRATQHKVALLHIAKKQEAQESLGHLTSDTIIVHKGTALQQIASEDTSQASIEPLAPLFGELFKSFRNPAYMFVDDYVIFANHSLTLQLMLDDYLAQQVINKRLDYLPLRDNLSSTANVLLYLNFTHARSLLQSLFNESFDLRSYPGLFNHFNRLAVQLSKSNDYFYTNGSLLAKGTGGEDTTQSIQLTPEIFTLDTALAIAPQYVLNHETKNLEIIVQDSAKNLYLIDPRGKVLWKRELDGIIQSKIRQLDYYKNGYLQYVFNTPEQIYVIDRRGKDVEEFPLELEATAANPMHMVNYNQAKRYRYFIACKNNNLYGYYKDGKPLTGWHPKPQIGKITLPLQHFYHERLDYLVTMNTSGTFYGFNRKGEHRIPETELNTTIRNPFYLDASGSSPTFLTTDVSGTIYQIDPQGQVTKEQIDQFSKNHFFAYKNVAGDERKEYVFVDKRHLKVYDQEKNLMFSYVFEQPITLRPLFLRLPHQAGNTYKIGVVSQKNNKIFLFNEDGSPYQPFPLKGHTHFDIEEIYHNGISYCLVGGTSNKVMLYKLNKGAS